MGIRAHLITRYKGETFSLGEERVWEIIEENSGDLGLTSIQLDMSGCGIVSMDLEIAKQIAKDPKVDKSTRKYFREDIRWAEKHNQDWLKYYCF